MRFTKFMPLVGVLLQLLIASTSFAAQKSSCESAKAEFKDLYIKIQQNLNYEGKDASLVKGKVKLTAHDGKDYEGKVFEEALFHEYQNSLTKVAKVYQFSKKTGNDDLNSNPALVDFFKAIDKKLTLDIGKFENLLNELKKASELKNTSAADKKFIINENDVYLLRQLLTHAQDKICGMDKYAKQSKKDAKLENIKNAPLNRMLYALQNGNISADSDLQLVNTKTVTESAVAQQMQSLREWMQKLKKDNVNCFNAIGKNPLIVQNNIQSCNYKLFVDSLFGNSNDANLKSILNFINANQKHGKATPMAETGIDNLKLEAYIDQTFKNLNDKISCTEIGDKSKKVFIRNLPYINNKFDFSKLKCKIADKEVDNNACASGIELVSDDLGRGLEVRPTAGSKVSSFSFDGDSPTCQNMKLSGTTASTQGHTDSRIVLSNAHAIPPTKPDAVKPDVVKPDAVKPDVVKPDVVKPDVVKPDVVKPDVVKPEVVKPDFVKPAAKQCDQKKCTNKDAVWDASLITGPPQWDSVLNNCYSAPLLENAKRTILCSLAGELAAIVPTIESDASCLKVDKKLDPNSKLCVEDFAICKLNTKKRWNDGKCSDVATAEEKCNELRDKNGDLTPGIIYWDSKENTCKDKRENKSREVVDSVPEEKPTTTYANKPVPGRFTPVTIPTRQVYILPGMP
ncbi:MAG: hypothetical protein H7281_11250 [Bacteriovorax sp.]|nr:hypothetical protein [Bacteriovorax sp.]